MCREDVNVFANKVTWKYTVIETSLSLKVSLFEIDCDKSLVMYLTSKQEYC